MPILMTTPDMREETWLGAAAWAGGSQKCRGKMPALKPKPTRNRRKVRVPREVAASPGAAGVNRNPPAPAPNRPPGPAARPKAANRHRVPV